MGRRGGEKPLLQFAGQRQALGGGSGGEDEGEWNRNQCSIPSSTSSQTPLQRPVAAEALGERRRGRGWSKKRRQARRGGFRAPYYGRLVLRICFDLQVRPVPCPVSALRPSFSGSQPTPRQAMTSSTQRCSPPATSVQNPSRSLALPPVEWRALLGGPASPQTAPTPGGPAEMLQPLYHSNALSRPASASTAT